MRIPGKYYYTFRASTGVVVAVLRGDGAPKMVDGGGGWETVARPRRIALTQWSGGNPYAMDVPILFDGVHDRSSVEDDIARLNGMQVGDDFSPPPTVTIDGAVPIKGATWVLQPQIEWGDDVYWVSSGGQSYRTRQDAVVHLLQYNPEARVKITATNTLPNRYVVHRSGETLRSIAKAMYGDATKWTKIKAANPKVRDPNKLAVGTKLVIP